ncbi:hypothetical protein [Nocardia sp. N2S4-5]|uniref:oxidoreductase n=1 Tax=Nocardia sp. N2S4-5 TaxID=3351565 RepID=UPI0037CD1EFB
MSSTDTPEVQTLQQFVSKLYEGCLKEAPNGFERMAAFYAERARGGAGLIVTGGIAPNEAGRPYPGGPRWTTDEEVAQHRAVTDPAHAGKGKIAMQILHFGRYADHPELVAPVRYRLRSARMFRANPPMPRSNRP